MFLVLSGMEKSWMTQWEQAWSFMDILVNKDFLPFPHLNYQSFIASAVMCNSLWIQFGLNVQMYITCILSQVTPHQYLYSSAEQHSGLWSFILAHMKVWSYFTSVNPSWLYCFVLTMVFRVYFLKLVFSAWG